MKNEKVYEVNVYPDWIFDCYFNPISSGTNEVLATTDYERSIIKLIDVFHVPEDHLFRVSFVYTEALAKELEEFYDMNESFLVRFYYGDYLEKVAEIKMNIDFYDTPDDENDYFGITLKVSEDVYGIHTIDTSENVFKLFSKVIHTAFEEGSKDYNYVKITVQRNE